jgi:hypothetical protein
MAQLNLYVPDEEATRLRNEAEKAGLPLSRYVLSLIDRNATRDAWPPGYFESACGFLKHEPDFAEPLDAPPEPVDLDRPRA